MILTTEELMRRKYRVIVAGSRGYNDYSDFEDKLISFLKTYIPKCKKNEIAFISGKAHSGPDKLIVEYCEQLELDYAEFLPDWSNVNVDGAVVQVNQFGRRYNARAGHMRNEEMAKHGTHALVYWDGESPGSKDMIYRASGYDLPCVVIRLDKGGVSETHKSRDS